MTRFVVGTQFLTLILGIFGLVISQRENNVCPTFEDYYTMKNNSKCWYDLGADYVAPDIIQLLGYPVQTYRVVTKDGYILTLFRIPNDSNKNPYAKKHPVYLQHGLVATCNNFLALQKDSLAFVLWEAGYDVWLGNYRGTFPSEFHVNMTTRDREFWATSMDDVALIDLPAIFHTIISHTSKDNQIIYIGHSLGTTFALMYGSEFPEEAKSMIKMFVLLCPAYTLNNMISPYKWFAPYGNWVVDTIRNLEIERIVSEASELSRLVQPCMESPPVMRLCMQLYNLFYGPNADFGPACELPTSRSEHSHYICTDEGEVKCLPGWDGDLCDVPRCRSGCDPMQGYCNRPGECLCKLGYYGDKCNKCIPLPGCQHGYCNTSFECICHEGWDGLFCSEPICRQDCHQARGYCTEPGDCKCRLGWSGKTCRDCQVLPGCINGYCEKPLECKCYSGFTGILCQTPICSSTCHKERGYCRKPGECRCKVGWWGKDCEKCFPYPGCVNGTCNRPWECNCKKGWGGMLCNEALTYCEDNPDICKNGAKCISLTRDDGSFRCLCREGTFGKFCELSDHSFSTKPISTTNKTFISLNKENQNITDFQSGFKTEKLILKSNEKPIQNLRKPLKNSKPAKIVNPMKIENVSFVFAQDADSNIKQKIIGNIIAKTEAKNLSN